MATKAETKGAAAAAKDLSKVKGRKRIPGAKKIILKELAPFTRQLGAMLSSGLPVVQTLTALEEQTNNQV